MWERQKKKHPFKFRNVFNDVIATMGLLVTLLKRKREAKCKSFWGKVEAAVGETLKWQQEQQIFGELRWLNVKRKWEAKCKSFRGKLEAARLSFFGRKSQMTRRAANRWWTLLIERSLVEGHWFRIDFKEDCVWLYRISQILNVFFFLCCHFFCHFVDGFIKEEI